MADYRDLLRRAVEALPENNGAARRDVYEKARKALVGQLDSIKPALPAREKTQHRLQLEDCIREVEQEATERLLGGLSKYDEVEPAAPVVPAPVPAPAPVARKPEPVAEKTEVTPEVSAEREPVAEKPKRAKKATGTKKYTVDAKLAEKETSASKDDADGADKSEDTLVAAPPAKDEKAPTAPIQDVKTPDVAPEKSDADQPVESSTPAPRTVDEILAQAELNQSKKAEASIVPVVENSAVTSDVSGAISDLAVLAVDKADSISVDVPKIDVPAMSSVREVEVEPQVTPEIKSGDPQSTIDHAIAALDREASGDEADKPAVGSASAGISSDAISADATDAGHIGSPSRDEGGSNALTIFLVVFLLLLVGVGGAGYWAWKEGFVNLDTLFASEETVVTENQDVANAGSNIAAGNTEATPDDVTSSDKPLVVADDGANKPVRDVTETVAQPNVDDKTEDRLPTQNTSSEPATRPVHQDYALEFLLRQSM